MKISRGDVVICVTQGDYGKPRPAVVVQSDLFNETHPSITLCPITSEVHDASLIRVSIGHHPSNGLHNKSQVMVDKIVSIPRTKIKEVVGKISMKELDLVQRTLKNWLAL
ncbi:MAG: type II toxin-antitoxin system PemK/MazF family toxin [Myxococcaceae bacterium]|nr:type II toxin-antitoxin system PemK/MazF family toxin [Myxococcaceae bacterium]MBH2006647.1 type II toxin-antitoxin system PemK/MazF family toxin [Myxococcaceae bacterium]